VNTKVMPYSIVSIPRKYITLILIFLLVMRLKVTFDIITIYCCFNNQFCYICEKDSKFNFYILKMYEVDGHCEI
jgi:hypothetical protein